MQDPRRPAVAPPLQLAAYGQSPSHADPSVHITGRVMQPVSHRGELSQPPSPIPARPSAIEIPNMRMAPPPRIGDQTGSHAELPQPMATVLEGSAASAWSMRRNYRPIPAVEPGETEG